MSSSSSIVFGCPGATFSAFYLMERVAKIIHGRRKEGNVTFNYLEVRIEMRLQEMADVTFKMIRPVS